MNERRANILRGMIRRKAAGPAAAVLLPAAAGFGGAALSGLFQGMGRAFGAVPAAASLTLDAVKELALIGAKTALVVPVVGGAAAGLIHSRATSPAEREMKIKEQQLVNARLAAMTDTNIRRLAADLQAHRDALPGREDGR